ncbi:hypothetical protein [Actinomyces glycerinitolerans]|uniref:hypothetical protein n=1 Tax=Actinomyces glycerinitolerans TaxID=1892869 RepID=UPI001114A17F|nr:hypothetical protein [Actinomyces glycerinitolerans]
MILALGAGVYVVFWWPLPQGTPELAPEVEALRSQALIYTESRPRQIDDASLILAAANSEYVWVNFARGTERVPSTKIPVGSSTEVLGCTITVLESHPERPRGRGAGSASSWALIAVQCPESATPTATDPTAQDEPTGAPTP